MFFPNIKIQLKNVNHINKQTEGNIKTIGIYLVQPG